MMLGNLTVKEIEERTGVSFPEEIRDFMNQTHNPDANNISKGKWHCFDMPFTLVCGDMDTALKIYNSVKERSGDFKEQLQISLQS